MVGRRGCARQTAEAIVTCRTQYCKNLLNARSYLSGPVMISPVSISFSEEMNTSDVLECWLEGLGQYATSEESRCKIMLDTSPGERPRHQHQTPTSSPTLPTISCPPSPLTKSEVSEARSIDVDDELRVERQFYHGLSARSGDSFATNTLHGSKLHHAPQDVPLLSNHIVHTALEPWPSCTEGSSTLPSHFSTSTQSQDSITIPEPPPLRNPPGARIFRFQEHGYELATHRSRTILRPHMALVKSRGNKVNLRPLDVTLGTENFTRGESNSVQEKDQFFRETNAPGRPDRGQETNFVAGSIRNEPTVSPVSKNGPGRRTSHFAEAPYLSQASYSTPVCAANIENMSRKPRKEHRSPGVSAKDEDWTTMLQRIPSSPTPPPKDGDLNGNIYTLSLRCKSSATQSSMLRDCGMLVTEHSPRPVRQSPSRKFPKLNTQDNRSHVSRPHSEFVHDHSAQRNSSTTQPSPISNSPKIEMEDISEDYCKNFTPPPSEPSLKPSLATAEVSETARLNRKRKIPHGPKAHVANVESRHLLRLPLDTNPDHNMEQYKANSKAVRRSTIAPFGIPHISTQHRKEPKPDPDIHNDVKHQYSAHSTTKSQAPLLQSADCHDSQLSTADRTKYSQGTVGNHNVSNVHVIHPDDFARSTAVSYTPPRNNVKNGVPMQNDIHYHHSPQPSVDPDDHSLDRSVPLYRFPRTSLEEQTSCFDVRLKALERQNELLSATLMAVLDTSSTLKMNPHVQSAPPVRSPQWADRVARRAAASGRAAPLSKEFSGLGISMGMRHGEGGDGGGREERYR